MISRTLFKKLAILIIFGAALIGFSLVLVTVLVKHNEKKSSKVYGGKQYISNTPLRSNNLGKSEYICTGACLCEKNDRRASAILARGLTVLLSAFSVTMAMNIAKDKFQEDCIQTLEDECSYGTILSVVEDCEEDKTKSQSTSSELLFKFSCKGNCISNPEFDRKKAEKLGYDKEMLDNFDCEMHTLTRDILVDESKAKSGGLYDKLYYFIRSRLNKLLDTRRDEAQQIMRYEHLKQYCKGVEIPFEGEKPKYDVDVCMGETQVSHKDRSRIKCVEQT